MFTFTACPNRTKRNTHSTGRLTKDTAAAQLVFKRAAQCLALLVLSVLFVPTAIRAQVLYGSMVGTVTDPNGAAVPGAKVEATNVSTGDVSTTTTDDRGAYVINDLQVGIYKVTF